MLASAGERALRGGNDIHLGADVIPAQGLVDWRLRMAFDEILRTRTFAGLLPLFVEDQRSTHFYMEREAPVVREQQAVEVIPVREKQPAAAVDKAEKWTDVVKRKQMMNVELSGNGSGMMINL